MNAQLKAYPLVAAPAPGLFSFIIAQPKRFQLLPSSNISEVQIVEGILRGSKKYETLLFHKYSKGLVLMLSNRSGDYSLAEDLAQDTLVVVINRLRREGINNPKNLTAFVYQTAKFILIGFQRKRRHKLEVNFDGPIDSLVVTTPEDNLIQAFTRDQTHRLIAELKVERDREILMRFYVYEHTKQQVCEDLDLSAEHFSRVIHRARQRLKEIVTEEEIH